MAVLGKLLSLNIAKAVSVPYGSKVVETGIFKTSSGKPLRLTRTGLVGDQQADTVNHGGPDKAVCVYSADHFAYWEEQWSKPVEAGAFGENFTISGLTEENIHIGDIIRIGEAVVQVSQPRQPCFKLGVKHQIPELSLQVQQSGYTGYYFRVLQEGIVQEGDELIVEKRHEKGISIAEANVLMYENKEDRAGISRLLSVQELADSWQEHFSKRLDKLSAQE
ncbi:MOSC domain-containing protein [Paenibacillus solisilvae]|uniref:MOSC domain-containing protein n=1 Tax=Paenibacillus solisilvae TaxID=2486751 RepID=A0ABW0VWC8_9BACL